MRKSWDSELDAIVEGPVRRVVDRRPEPEEPAEPTGALLAPVRGTMDAGHPAAVVAEAILSLSKERAIQAELTMTSLSTAHAASCQSQERASRAVRWALRGWAMSAFLAVALLGGGWWVITVDAGREAELASAKAEAGRASKQALELQEKLVTTIAEHSRTETSAGRADERSQAAGATITELRERLADAEEKLAAVSARAQAASEELAGASRIADELRRRVTWSEARLEENQKVMLEAWSRLAMITAGGPALLADGESIGKELLDLRQLLATANRPVALDGAGAAGAEGAIDPMGLLRPAANAGVSVEPEKEGD